MRTLSSLLCQPAPDAAETTKLGAVRTQPSIPQFLHTNETSENLSNALHTLLVHCLRLSAGPSATLGVRGLRCPPPARGGQVKCAHLSRLPQQCHLRAPSRQVPRRLPPISPFFIRAPALGRRGRASGSRSAFLPPRPPASVRLGGLGPRDGGARVWNRRGPGPRQNRRCGGFANTNGNQGS